MRVIYEGDEKGIYKSGSFDSFARSLGAETVFPITGDVDAWRGAWYLKDYSALLKIEGKTIKQPYIFLPKQASVKVTLFGPEDGMARLEAIILEEAKKAKP